MYINAYANRKNGFIYVVVQGQLPTPCDEAKIVDFYPGGNIRYFRDPGSAQIFIKESRKPGLENSYCIQVLGELWTLKQVICDNYHDTVEIFINNYSVAKIKVFEDFRAL